MERQGAKELLIHKPLMIDRHDARAAPIRQLDQVDGYFGRNAPRIDLNAHKNSSGLDEPGDLVLHARAGSKERKAVVLIGFQLLVSIGLLVR